MTPLEENAENKYVMLTKSLRDGDDRDRNKNSENRSQRLVLIPHVGKNILDPQSLNLISTNKII